MIIFKNICAFVSEGILEKIKGLLTNSKTKKLVKTNQTSLSIKTQNSSLSPSNNSINYIEAATSENTRKAYRFDIKHFENWGGLLPATSESILQYLHTYAPLLKHSTLSRRLIAIKHWHEYQGFNDPTQHPLIKKTLIGIRKIHGTPKNKAQAITLDQLKKIIEYLNYKSTLRNIRDKALLQIGFFGAFRRSELVGIQIEHINAVNEGLEILIPRSKTDSKGEGTICALPFGKSLLCPVTALYGWLNISKITEGFIFRAIDKKDNISSKPLDDQNVNLIIKRLTKACNMNFNDFSGHSLRRGLATQASLQGAPLQAIMRQGRWKHINTVLGYIEESQRFTQNAASLLLK
ncbi:MAG: integrase family protein [Francisellaceae bacterium]|nr:integrase family protein [Francisellaceae bacterium]